MKCPYCKHNETKVLETRDTGSDITRRRRECVECQKRFTTYEQVEFTSLGVIKRNGTRELYNRQKIVKSIELAAQKRPIDIDLIEKIATDVEVTLKDSGLKDVKSKSIGEEIMNNLKKIDEIAYIRFASVYRDFKDVDTFKQELDRLQKVKENGEEK